MSQFYSRYVPPTKPVPIHQIASSTPEKRKRAAEDETGGKRQKLVTLHETLRPSNREEDSEESVSELAFSENTSSARNVLDKYRVTETAKREGKEEIRHRQQNGVPKEVDLGINPKKKKRIPPELLVQDESQDSEDEENMKRHAGIFSKFGKSQDQAKSVKISDESGDVDEPNRDQEELELHGLEPLPQPEDVERPIEKPSYSTLPLWQANAVTIVPGTHPKFEELGISKETLQNLQRHGLEQAFPVQSTVIPLLLNGEAKHRGDLCISAATGSGKTLAYVLPMIEDIKKLQSTKLRGIIVVPTRELVQQVQHLCQMCAEGTSIKITTALGSKSIKDEQDALVSREKRYDPEQYIKQRDSPVNWSKFSLEQLLQTSPTDDPYHAVNFVTSYRSKVDILITTPGRLVDHLRNTPGFTLDDIRWLVVDEADRLLNESYQEWIEVVVPAIQSHAATQERDNMLRRMKIGAPKRHVTKVLLSATMTRDISKLNSLGLENPKLIILGGSSLEKARDGAEAHENNELPADANGIFHLPPTLSELVVQVKDAAEKPLYLLQLLNQQVIPSARKQKKIEASSLAETSDSDSSSDSSSDTSSDEDTTESDMTSSSDDSEDEDRDESIEKGINLPPPQRASRALVFTRSTESATRLSRLLELLAPSLAPQISTLTRSTASSAKSRQAFSKFRNSKISILIATDRASRGLDVPGLNHVISYDVPSSVSTYIHRVGRTARAGKEGNAWTLVEHREGAWFWQEIGGKGKKNAQGETNESPIHRTSKVKRFNLPMENESLKAQYEEVLKKLGEEVMGR